VSRGEVSAVRAPPAEIAYGDFVKVGI